MGSTDPTRVLHRLDTKISFRKRSDRRQQRERGIRAEEHKVLKLAKDLVYPRIRLERRHNVVYDKSALLDALACAAANHLFTKGGCQTFAREMSPTRGRTPDSKTILYHIRNLDKEGKGLGETKEMFDLALRDALSLARRLGIFKRRMDIAIDLHDQPYYGDKNDYMVVESKHRNGTSHFFRYMTCSVVEAGRRFTIGCIPVHKLSSRRKIMGKLLDLAAREVKIRFVYLDRGFYTREMIGTLQVRGLKFLMPAPMNVKVKPLVNAAEAPSIIEYTMGRGDKQVKFNPAIVKDENGVKRAFATNLQLKNGDGLFKLYGKRWGIETSYRVVKDFAPKTTSKKYIVRLFYFLFSVCFYNIWVLANILLGRILSGSVPEKPLMPAALLTRAFYRLKDT